MKRRKDPFRRAILGVYKAPSCSCTKVCPHGTRCLGGHTSYPDSHWYPCNECTPQDTCRCSHERSEHALTCRRPGCGCRTFRPPDNELA